MALFKILGIDQSLVCTGWSLIVFDGKDIKKIRYGIIQTKKLRGDERLYFIERELGKILGKYYPRQVVMEGYAFTKRKNYMSFQLGELGWAIRRTAYELKIPLSVMNPKTLKKKMTGSGNADKDAVIKSAVSLSGISFNKVAKSKRNNVADAFGLAYIAGIERRD